MFGMFFEAAAFNQDAGGWNTSKVTDMCGMFNKCDTFNQDASGQNTSKVTGVKRMFNACAALNQDAGGWNMPKVTHMCGIFVKIGHLTLGVNAPSGPTLYMDNVPGPEWACHKCRGGAA